MNVDDRLEQLLRRADAATPPSASDARLSDAVRRRFSRQKTRRRVTASGAAALLVILVAIVVLKQKHEVTHLLVKAPTAPPTDVAIVLAQLRSEALMHDQIADALAASHKQFTAPPLAVVASSAPTPDAHIERDRAALILVYEADQHAKENRPAEAIASYRRAIELFPHTHWADVARERLKLIQT